MLDPPEAAAALTQAGCLLVQLDGMQFYLKNATASQLEALRLSRSRHLSVQAAKKALRASALLSELQLDLGSLPSGSASTQVCKAPDRTQDPAPVPHGNLAIVPFIKTVKPETEIPPSAGFTSRSLGRAVPHSLAAWYTAAWQRAVQALALLPLAFMYVALLYSALGFVYLAAHPELLVQAAFGLLDLIPNYAAFASEAMWSQLKIELAARFR